MKTAETNVMPADRDRIIIRTSLIGILANLLLAAGKAAVGLVSHSIAVLLDALNNVSDALSSVITIIGAKLAGRKPDKKHPLGHGRIEYVSAMIVAALVLYAGIAALVESVKKILSPVVPSYGATALILLGAAIAVKLLLGRYVRSVGRKVRSGSLTASGSDALFDAILSLSVLLSAIFFLLTGISLEAYVGAVIALFIIKSGVGMMAETLDEIIGKRMDRELVEAVYQTVCEEEEVSGAFDLILHSYGPEHTVGSLHIEIPDVMRADEIDALERRITTRVFRENGVILTGIGIYAKNTVNDEIKAMQADVTRRIALHEGVLQIHGFYADLVRKKASVDVILDFGLDDRQKVYGDICRELSEAYPDFSFSVTMDIDV